MKDTLIRSAVVAIIIIGVVEVVNIVVVVVVVIVVVVVVDIVVVVVVVVVVLYCGLQRYKMVSCQWASCHALLVELLLKLILYLSDVVAALSLRCPVLNANIHTICDTFGALQDAPGVWNASLLTIGQEAQSRCSTLCEQ